ncbi:PREDICTED: protein stum [Drosophila arizonae]|uniref:Protein stum n=1 Tax=Drosophila arizonae TaxID=7263 RepID=A0ABM1PBQ6_DROAR|nr:PREDICTED: protein stum [Drosophila arizonae]
MEKGSANIQPYSSLFGDPVPPPQPEDYFGTAAFETIRAGSIEIPSSEEDTLVAAVALNTLMGQENRRRLFSEVPYSTLRAQSQPIPRLQPPDIQILPNSSGGSSSEQLDSPNFMLLTPQDIVNKPDVYDCEYEQATQATERTFEEQETQTGNRTISELDWYRPTPQHFAEFSRIPKLRPSSKMVMSMKHEEMPLSPLATMLQDSNGSSSSGEEQLLNTEAQQMPVRSATPTMDRNLILSPKQYLQQQQQQQQRELLLSERQLLESMRAYGLEKPQTPSLQQSQLPESSTEMEEQTQSQILSPVVMKESIATGGEYRVGDTRLHKKSAFTILSVRSPKSSLGHSPSATPVTQRQTAISRHPSLQSTTTSSNAAQPQPQLRPRRKSLTASRLPQLPVSSQPLNDDSPRPSVQFNMSGRYSPSKLAMPTKGILQQRDSLTSSVDTYTPRAQRRDSIGMTSSPFGQRIKSLESLPLISQPYRSAIPRLHSSSMELDKETSRFRRSSMEMEKETSVIPPGTLPRPLKPNPNPTRKQRGLLGVINKSIDDDSPGQPARSNWLSLDDLTMGTQLPKSTFDPMRIQARRRSSSTSPERRSSTQTASDRRSSNLSSITTSDFSFRRPSTLSTLPATTKSGMQRRKSVYQPASKVKSPRRQPFPSKDSKRAKIVKPSTLSPIIGTPNKDSGKDSPLHGDAYEDAHRDTPSDLSMRRDSVSRIPVRSRQDSYPNSRSNSPLKDFANLSSLSGRNSRASNSRSPSQTTIRSSFDNQAQLDSRLTPTRFSSSRPVSRGPPSRPSSRMAQAKDNSQANSRANSRADSRGNSRANSRADSRANSRADSLANSRANSRLSVRSSIRSTSISPSTATRNGRQTKISPNRRKSVSTSPKGLPPKGMLGRRMSLSPAVKQGKSTPKLERKESPLSSKRRSSRSLIPTSVRRSVSKSSSPAKKSTDKPSDKSATPKSRRPTQILSKPSPKEKSNKAESAKKKNTAIIKPEFNLKRNGSKILAKATPKSSQGNKPNKTPAKQQKQGAGQKNGKADKPTSKANGASGLPKPQVREAAQQKNISKPNGSPATKIKLKESPEKLEATAAAAGAPAATAAAASKETTEDSINPLAIHVGNAVNVAAEALPAVRNEVNAKTGAVKRQTSNMSNLVRMSSRLSLVSNKKRSDSAQNRKVATVPELAQEGEVSNRQHTPQSGDSLDPAATSSEAMEGTTEAQKTVNEHLIDQKIHESESGLAPITTASPTPSGVTMLAKAHDSAPRLDTADGSNAQRSSPAELQKSPLPPTQPIEASISVLNALESDAASAQLSAVPEAENERANPQEDHAKNLEHPTTTAGLGDDYPVDDKRLSPDGQGSTVGSGGVAKCYLSMLTKKKKNSVVFHIDLPQNSLIEPDKYLFRTGSQEFLKDDGGKAGCCRCCTTLCMRFRRSRCMRCCGLRKDRLQDAADEQQPVLASSRSSASTTTQLEIVDETKKKSRCWPTSNCCKSCRKKPKSTEIAEEKQTKMSVEPMHQSTSSHQPKHQSKCGMCLRKVFCCRSVNKIDPITGDETELSKCCFCIPCRRKNATVAAATEPKVAWRDQDPELGIAPTDAAVLEGSSMAPSAVTATEDMAKMSCCKRFWLMLFCCRKKPRQADARRQSIVAPPTSEETRRKLHNDLVEYTSKMKAAIPVLPLYLAWFCAFCNVVFPGLGTLLSGLFCLCVGIPRFSQFDSARARIGSFIINIIVAVSQFFCVLFCFVGWGWSIWWGTIMLKCAKKLSKIKKVERLELEEEQRQADIAAAAVRAEAEAAKT